MPHTNPWSDNTPLGSDAADTMDNNMRRARLDVAERMNDILGGDNWRTQDPVTLPGIISNFKFAKRYQYNDLASVASKATNPETLKALVIFRYTGTTDSGSNITIKFGSLFETWNIPSLDLDTAVFGMVINATTNDVAFLFEGALVGDTLTIAVRKSDGSLYPSDNLEGHFIFWASQKPT